MELTQDIVRELLIYEENSGVLIWRQRDRKWFKSEANWKTWNTRFAWTPAFTNIKDNGYKKGKIFDEMYHAHRLVWFYVHGYWPKNIDHINGKRHDNALRNLREVTRTDNMKNMKKSRRNKSGIIGVSWEKRKKRWVACIGVQSKCKKLGYFSKLEDAANARKSAEQRYGYHSNHGRD